MMEKNLGDKMNEPRVCPNCDILLPDGWPIWKKKCKTCWKHDQPYIKKSKEHFKKLLWKYRGNRNEWKRRTFLVDEPNDEPTLPGISKTSEEPKPYVDYGNGIKERPAKNIPNSTQNRRQLYPTYGSHKINSPRKNRVGHSMNTSPSCPNCRSINVRREIYKAEYWFRHCLSCGWKSEYFPLNPGVVPNAKV